MPEVSCLCGCGNRIPKIGHRGQRRSFVPGHQNKVRRWSKDERLEISERMKGSKNHRWNPNRSQVGRMGQGFLKSQKARLLSDNCKRCGSVGKLELDHIIPIFAGGTNDDSNAQTLCRLCNQKKRQEDIGRYGKLGELRKRPNPNWMGNSEPNQDGNILAGATTSGRVYKRPGTRLLAVEISCFQCGRMKLRSAWELRGYKSRPQPKAFFCSDECRLSALNGRHDSKFHQERPARTDFIGGMI